MKSIIITFLFLVFLFSCSPEKMLTKKIEGEWELLTIDGQPISPLTSTLQFSKDNNRSGNVFLTTFDNSSKIAKGGLYSLFKSQTITIAYSTDSTVDTHVYSVTKFTKNELILTEEGKGNRVFNYKKN